MRVLAVILCSLLTIALQAVAQETVSIQYTGRQFTTRDGLPKLQVTALMQDRFGYLWVGTKGGLARYDGLSFKAYPSISSGVGGICQLQDGRILVSGFRGLYIIDGDSVSPLYTDDRFSFYFCESKLIRHKAYMLLTGTGDDMLTGGCKLVSFDPATHRFTVVRPLPFVPFTFSYLNDSTLIAGGNNSDHTGSSYYIIHNNGNVSRPYMLPFTQSVRSDPAHAEGYYLAGDKEGNIYKLFPQGDSLSFNKIAKAGHKFSVASTYIYRAKDGSIFYCSQDGYLVRTRNGIEETIAPVNIMHKMTEDREGNSWVATEDGLYNFFSFSFKSYEFSFLHGKPPFLACALAAKDDGFWLGSYTNGLWKYTAGGRLQKVPGINLPVMYHPVIKNDTAYLPLSGGMAYIAKENVYSFRDSDYAHLYLYDDPISGRILSGTSGIRYFEGGKMHPFINDAALELQHMFVLSMCRDTYGKLWYGSAQGAGYIDQLGTCTPGVIKNKGSIIAMLCDSLGGLWMAGSNGLYFYDYQTATSIHHPVLQSQVGALYNYKNKYLLAASTKGLAIIDLAAFHKTHKVIISAHTFDNGFTGLDYSQNGISEDHDGNILISTPNTLLSFNPGQLSNNTTLFKVHIESITVSSDNTDWQPYRANASIHAPANNIRIHFNAICFSQANNITYRYRLHNFAGFAGWSEPTRVTEATFTNLDPGNYIFEVQSSADGINWTIPTVSGTIHIGEAWYQTLWFRLSLITAALGILYFIYRDTRLRLSIATFKLKQLRNEAQAHFFGNVSNNIDALMVTGMYEEASTYNRITAHMQRKLLKDAERDSRPLREELSFVSDYLQLEKLRFREKLEYHINVAAGIDQSVQVPVLAVHTLAENAVKHGLMHKQGTGILRIDVTTQDKYLVISVADNGIGRQAAAGMETHSTGKGLYILESLMELYNTKLYNRINRRRMYYEVKDLHEGGIPTGTIFYIFIPIAYKF